MLHTTEARWFIRNDIPARIYDWCHDASNGFEKQPQRTDFYL